MGLVHRPGLDQWLKLALSKGPIRLGVLCYLIYKIQDEGQIPETQYF
jgi:hypothetical protein